MPLIYLKKSSDLIDYITKYSSALIVVDFYADWCRPCVYIGEMFEKELLPHYGDKLILIKVDSDNTELESLSQQFQVRGIPRLIFYHNQKIVDDVTGAQTDTIKRICETYCK
jgi:thioredoxin-like negative regulator of GroEL